jgi:hypothetical protein
MISPAAQGPTFTGRPRSEEAARARAYSPLTS